MQRTVRNRSQRVNDFVVKFANVNGSGSASANELFAKSILRMGVPVAPRNIFPSNIQGLPTWYEVRVIGSRLARPPRRRRPDGGDEPADLGPGRRARSSRAATCSTTRTKPLPPSKFRDDITVIGMPLTEICNATYTDARQRQLFKNIIYVGALSALLDIDAGEIARAHRRAVQGQGSAARSPTCKALHLGPRLRARHTSTCPLGHARQARRRGRRPDLHRRQQRRGAGLRLRRRHGLRVVPDHAVVVAGRGVRSATAASCRVDPATGKNKLRDRAGRGRARLDRHGHRRRLERRARVHRDLRARASR